MSSDNLSPNQELVEYVRSARAAGTADEEIRTALIANSWSEAEVDIVLRPDRWDETDSLVRRLTPGVRKLFPFSIAVSLVAIVWVVIHLQNRGTDIPVVSASVTPEAIGDSDARLGDTLAVRSLPRLRHQLALDSIGITNSDKRGNAGVIYIQLASSSETEGHWEKKHGRPSNSAMNNVPLDDEDLAYLLSMASSSYFSIYPEYLQLPASPLDLDTMTVVSYSPTRSLATRGVVTAQFLEQQQDVEAAERLLKAIVAHGRQLMESRVNTQLQWRAGLRAEEVAATELKALYTRHNRLSEASQIGEYLEDIASLWEEISEWTDVYAVLVDVSMDLFQIPAEDGRDSTVVRDVYTQHETSEVEFKSILVALKTTESSLILIDALSPLTIIGVSYVEPERSIARDALMRYRETADPLLAGLVQEGLVTERDAVASWLEPRQ